jgi:hypothetical protein
MSEKKYNLYYNGKVCATDATEEMILSRVSKMVAAYKHQPNFVDGYTVFEVKEVPVKLVPATDFKLVSE